MAGSRFKISARSVSLLGPRCLFWVANQCERLYVNCRARKRHHCRLRKSISAWCLWTYLAELEPVFCLIIKILCTRCTLTLRSRWPQDNVVAHAGTFQCEGQCGLEISLAFPFYSLRIQPSSIFCITRALLSRLHHFILQCYFKWKNWIQVPISCNSMVINKRNCRSPR